MKKAKRLRESNTENPRLERHVKDNIQHALSKINNNNPYWEVPVIDIAVILGRYDLVLLNGRNTEFDNSFSGLEGEERLKLGFLREDENGYFDPIENARVLIEWEELATGRVEVKVFLEGWKKA